MAAPKTVIQHPFLVFKTFPFLGPLGTFRILVFASWKKSFLEILLLYINFGMISLRKKILVSYFKDHLLTTYSAAQSTIHRHERRIF